MCIGILLYTMLDVICRDYDSYQVAASVVMEYDNNAKDSLTGEVLEDEIILRISYHINVTVNLKLSLDNIDDFIENLESSNSDYIDLPSGPSLDLDECDTTKNQLIDDINEIRDLLSDIEYKSPYDNVVIIEFLDDNIDILFNPISERENYNKIVIFGDVAISMDKIDSCFDFEDFLNDGAWIDLGVRCDYCENLKFEGRCYKVDEAESSLVLCSDCTREIRRKCASIGENKSLLREIIADDI